MIGWLLRILVIGIGRSLRWRIEDPGGQLTGEAATPTIIAFWHNRIFLLPFLYRFRWPSRRGRSAAVLVSASKDGEKLAGVLKYFNLVCVRGSTSRRGKEALRKLTRCVQDGYDAGITPDGPRGPKYIVQPGVINLAQLTGAPIVPVSYSLSRKIAFNSWDKFMAPLPFARCVVRIGAPIAVPRDADEQLQEQKRIELETALRQLSPDEEAR